MAIIKNFERGEAGVEEQIEGRAHTICITNLASFWGVKFWNGISLSLESRSIEYVAGNMDFVFLFPV